MSSAASLFDTSAGLANLISENKLNRDLEKYSNQQRRYERKFAARYGRKTSLDARRTANIDSQTAQLQALVDQRKKARLALWGSVGVLALVAFIAFRPPPTVRVAPMK